MYRGINIFKCGRLCTTVRRFQNTIGANNIVRSPVPDLKIPNVFIDEIVWKDLDKWPNNTAVVCSETGRKYSYIEVYQKSMSVSNFLRNKVPGLKEKDVICIIIPNIPEFAIVFMGIIQAGFKVMTLNPDYTAGEMIKGMKDSQIKFTFTLNKVWPRVKQSIQELQEIIPVTIVKCKQDESIPMGTINFNDMLEEGYVKKFDVHRSTDDVALIISSSGTTGLPKGVLLTHKCMGASFYQSTNSAYSIIRKANGNFQEVIPLLLPMYHLYGLFIVLLQGLALGSKLAILPKFESDPFLNLLNVYQPTFVHLVPPVALFLINNEKVRMEHIQRIVSMIVGGAPISADVVNRVNEKFQPKASVLQLYGLTEASGITHMQSLRIENGYKVGGAGFVIPNAEFMIVSTEKCDEVGLGPNVPGEIIVRGPQNMQGYYNNTEATKASFTQNGWLRTGDIGYYDDSGHLFVTDRLKELIKVQGFQVAPAELEDILRSHPDVLDAAVVGVANEKYGEIPKAFVVLKQKQNVNIKNIEEFVASQVIGFKQLRGGIEVLDSIPKSPTGKILRRLLRK